MAGFNLEFQQFFLSQLPSSFAPRTHEPNVILEPDVISFLHTAGGVSAGKHALPLRALQRISRYANPWRFADHIYR